MTQFIPLSGPVLALAQEIQRRALENPQIVLFDAVQSLLEERPALDLKGASRIALQINDLMKISEPGPQDLRVALLLFMPGRRGTLFTVKDLPLAEVLLFPTRCPIAPVAGSLASALEGSWPEVAELVRHLPVTLPSQILDPHGRPAEAHHPVASGPQPENIQDFMRPDEE